MTRPVSKRWTLVAATLAVLAIGCGSDEADGGGGANGGRPDEPVKIRMGWGIPAEEINYVLMEHPEVAEHLGTWYEIEWQQLAGGALRAQGLAAETLDCGSVGGLSAANALDQGADIVLTGVFIEERLPYFATTWMVRKDSGIETLEDLRGKTVATFPVGGSPDYLQDYYIEQQAGLEADKDYKKVEVPFPQMQETLLSGRVDMGLFPQPFYGAIDATGEVKPMFRTTDVIDPSVVLLNACRRSFVEDNETAFEKFQEDWTAVANWVLDPKNRDEVIQASSASTQIPADVLERFLLSRQDYFRPENGALNVEALQREWDLFRERGAFEQDLSVTGHVIEDLLPPSGQDAG